MSWLWSNKDHKHHGDDDSAGSEYDSDGHDVEHGQAVDDYGEHSDQDLSPQKSDFEPSNDEAVAEDKENEKGKNEDEMVKTLDATNEVSRRSTTLPSDNSNGLNQKNSLQNRHVSSSSLSSSDDDEDSHHVDEAVQQEIMAGIVPAIVGDDAEGARRARLDSGLTFGENDDDDEENQEDDDEDDEDDEEEQQAPMEISVIDDSPQKAPSSASSSLANRNSVDQHEGKSAQSSTSNEREKEEDATSMQEKQSLLVLAAEHDRVDILNAILASAASSGDDASKQSGDSTTKNNSPGRLLLRGALSTDGTMLTIPPLHIAVSYGSVNATNCLLRMGADPSLRPDVAAILENQKQHQGTTKANNSSQPIPHMQRYDQMSAWELVFGHETNKSKKSMDIAPSKREGIRHAFTAEALRCIGSDEVQRLDQLLQAGMPADIAIGHKVLYDWAVEMGALNCEELLRPTQRPEEPSEEPLPSESVTPTKGESTTMPSTSSTSGSAVRDRVHEPQSIPQLLNRLDELDSLSKALSACLDNLGEEVAVCSGLLLLGSGAAALASHVKSLRFTKYAKEEELVRLQDGIENSEDELAYWVKECGPEGEVIANSIIVPPQPPSRSRMVVAAGTSDTADHQLQQQLQAQLAASEHKIRMLRVSIADLSEENARNLTEVERRGLLGGISLVRGLREEIRDIDFQIAEYKSLDAEYRTKINLVQAKLREKRTAAKETSTTAVAALNRKKNHDDDATSSTTYRTVDLSVDTASPLEDSNRVAAVAQSPGLPSYDEPPPAVTQVTAAGLSSKEDEQQDQPTAKSTMATVTTTPPDSERIAKGHSTALAIRQEGGRGFFPLSLWQILMRIIGLGPTFSSTSSSHSTRSGSYSGNRATPAVII